MSITVKVDEFEGPLDLLLHLIEKNKMSIYDIHIAPITNQYMAYIEALESTREVSLENMSDFILMAATLLHIKSKMLLPKPEIEDPEDDPRGELVARLLEYKKMKHVSEELQEREKDAEKVFFRNMSVQLDDYKPADIPVSEVLGDVTMAHIYKVFADIVKKQSFSETPYVMDDLILKRDSYTIKEKSIYLLDLIELHESLVFHEIFTRHTSKMEMIVTFMALLELVHMNKIKIYQKRVLGDILISEGDKNGAIGDQTYYGE